MIERAAGRPFEIHTVPLNKKKPLWFRVSTDGTRLMISPAKDNAPSSALKMPRTITFEEFAKIVPYYQLRLNGHAVSQEVIRKTVNSVYIYGLIAEALKN